MSLSNSNLIFEILNDQIGLFESFENKENLLKLYESLIVSTEKDFDRILNGNLDIEISNQYYIISNGDLITTKLNKNDVTFVEQVTQLISANIFEKEYLAFSKPLSKPSIKVSEPTQLEILLGFKNTSLVLVSKSGLKPTKPGRGQKSCKFCNEVIGVRCLSCKFCNSSLT